MSDKELRDYYRKQSTLFALGFGAFCLVMGIGMWFNNHTEYLNWVMKLFTQ